MTITSLESLNRDEAELEAEILKINEDSERQMNQYYLGRRSRNQSLERKDIDKREQQNLNTCEEQELEESKIVEFENDEEERSSELHLIIENLENLKRQRANSSDRRTSSDLKRLTNKIISD